jgi:hypothetical protein
MSKQTKTSIVFAHGLWADGSAAAIAKSKKSGERLSKGS